MKETVYIETSFVSYLTANLSRDLIVAVHQQITKTWWEDYSHEFEIYISELVIRESMAGNKDASLKRNEVLKKLSVLELKQEVHGLAQQFLEHKAIPKKAVEDALHVATACVHGIDYLLTWNCKHIANAQIRNALIEVSSDFGYNLPIICTPEELMGGKHV